MTDLDSAIDAAVAHSCSDCVAMLIEARATHVRIAEMFNEAKAMLEKTIRLSRAAMLDMTPPGIPN